MSRHLDTRSRSRNPSNWYFFMSYFAASASYSGVSLAYASKFLQAFQAIVSNFFCSSFFATVAPRYSLPDYQSVFKCNFLCQIVQIPGPFLLGGCQIWFCFLKWQYMPEKRCTTLAFCLDYHPL